MDDSIRKIAKWLKTEHKITIGLKAKFFIIGVGMVLFWFMFFFGMQERTQGFNDELYLICTHAGLYECDELARAKDYCLNAFTVFERKNCTHNDNLTAMERYLLPSRLN